MDVMFEKQIRDLAEHFKYQLTYEEISLYLKDLGHFGISSIVCACIVFKNENEYCSGGFPSIMEFERLITKHYSLS